MSLGTLVAFDAPNCRRLWLAQRTRRHTISYAAASCLNGYMFAVLGARSSLPMSMDVFLWSPIAIIESGASWSLTGPMARASFDVELDFARVDLIGDAVLVFEEAGFIVNLVVWTVCWRY